jgi:hypothetical protein
VIAPTDEEDAAINRGIAQDPDNPEITEEPVRAHATVVGIESRD